jgi:HKD family nuclease
MVTIASNELAFAIGAPEPVVPGHALVVLRRSPSTYFEASAEEKAALWALVDVLQAQLEAELQPEGYEVRFATGAELHGAARALVHIIPQRARAPALATGGEQDPFARHLWPLFSGASEIAIVAAFVTETGLAAIERTVFGALRAGARLLIVTGDYLAFNQVEALQQLLGWSQLAAPGPSATGSERRLAVRVVETAQADGSERAFHPKDWLFESASFGVAFVGSSNLSRSALETGIEWNLRVERAIDPVGYASVRAAVDALWSGAIMLLPIRECPIASPWIRIIFRVQFSATTVLMDEPATTRTRPAQAGREGAAHGDRLRRQPPLVSRPHPSPALARARALLVARVPGVERRARAPRRLLHRPRARAQAAAPGLLAARRSGGGAGLPRARAPARRAPPDRRAVSNGLSPEHAASRARRLVSLCHR